MRVLWFTNTPSLAARHFNLNVVGGGWIQSLETAISGNSAIQLGIAFRINRTEAEKVETANTVYYSMPVPVQGKIKELIDKHRGITPDKEMLAHCLRVIDDFKPDLINVFGTEEVYGLIAEHVKIPVVIHIQGILTLYERRWFAASIRMWDLIRFSNVKAFLHADSYYHDYIRFRRHVKREKRIYAATRYFMGRTDWDRRVCSVLSPASTYYHCEEIIRDTFFKQQWSQSVQKEKVLFSTIQPNIYKGLETVLETAVLLKKILPFSFVWKIAGISPEHSIVKMFERKKGARFSENGVELCGSLGLEALVEHELKADLFIHPSHIDNSPNSVCEAMLLGLPVIATASGGTGSLLNDGEEGILIQDGDPFAMAGAISELLENTEKATAMGIAARKRAMLRHDPVKVSATLFDTYRLILEAEAKK